tara:strand:- start:204 stop:992 length:789 start_codon:yes stop_codon:yes gene_type:complete
MICRSLFLSALVAAIAVFTSADAADDPGAGKLTSGYWYAKPETRAMQDDDFSNPGMLWVEDGERLWNEVEGEAGKSCASCHGDAAESMRGVGATYPKYVESVGTLRNLGQQIDACRRDRMKAEPFEPESKPLLSLMTYVRHQSLGMPVNVSTDGPAREWYERGDKLYHQRIGQMDLACSMCHDDRTGHYLRAEHISQGQTNGFPTYLLRWGSAASTHRRFQFCNEQARAEPLPIWDDDYLAIELYVAARGNGLPIETPAVRR